MEKVYGIKKTGLRGGLMCLSRIKASRRPGGRTSHFAKRGFLFDIAFTSMLKRAIRNLVFPPNSAAGAFREIKAAECAPAGAKTTERKGKKKIG